MIAIEISAEQINNSATQLQYVPEILRQQFEMLYIEPTDKKYFLGLISGYFNTYNLLKANQADLSITNQIGALVAFLSDKYLNLE